MLFRRLAPLTVLYLALIPAADSRAGDWADEAAQETAVSHAVRRATVDYGKDGAYWNTQVIYEGTVERFPYGHRQPTLICAPLRICSIVLETGETVLDVLAGDTQHWQTFELASTSSTVSPLSSTIEQMRSGAQISVGWRCP